MPGRVEPYTTCIQGAALETGNPRRCVQPVTHRFVARNRAKGVEYSLGVVCDFHTDILDEFDEDGQSLTLEKL